MADQNETSVDRYNRIRQMFMDGYIAEFGMPVGDAEVCEVFADLLNFHILEMLMIILRSGAPRSTLETSVRDLVEGSIKDNEVILNDIARDASANRGMSSEVH